AEVALGRHQAAIAHLREARRLDPRSVGTLWLLGSALLSTHRSSEAREGLNATLALAPTNLSVLEQRAVTYLQDGDLAGARRALEAAPKEVDRTALVAYTANYLDLVWVLDEGQRDLLLRLTPSAFGDDRAAWALSLTQAYALLHDEANVKKH